MVDVHSGIAPPPLGYEIHELLERALLSGAIDAPEGAERRLVSGQPAAEEIFEAASRFVKRIALHIEERIARRGFGKKGEAERRLVRDELVDRLVSLACRNLQRRLTAQLREHLGAHAGRAPFVARRRELGHASDAGRLDLGDLIAAHPRDEAQMVVVAPQSLAVVVPRANRAVPAFDRIVPRAFLARGSACELQESALEMPIVC